MRAWLLGIVLTAFASGLARQLAPQGREQAMVRLAGGLLLTLAVLRPLAGMDWEGPALEAGAFQIRTEEQAAVYRKNQQQVLSAIIEDRTEAYILDKAKQLGLAFRVEVTAAVGESGIPLPDRVVIGGPYSRELAVCVEEEVGIPAEKTIWLEGNEWTERTQSES